MTEIRTSQATTRGEEFLWAVLIVGVIVAVVLAAAWMVGLSLPAGPGFDLTTDPAGALPF